VGLIAIKLDKGDALVDVRIISEGDDVVLATTNGMSIRFSQEDARSMGRATRGVRGIMLSGGDCVVGMVVAHPERSLLTVCENGFGKRTPFGPGEAVGDEDESPGDEEPQETQPESPEEAGLMEDAPEEAGPRYTGNMQYRRQKRGGKGLRDIRTTARNGEVIDVLSVSDDDEVLMVTAAGKIQRVRASDISQIGRNTQGVRIIRLDEDDTLVSCACIPSEILKG
jgi:DNA gyrase subunit A